MIRILLMLLLFVSVYASEFHVDKKKTNVVKFISDAPVEDFEGVTNTIDGYLFFEGDDLIKDSNLHFEVDLRKVDTGIGLRNRHMRENYLHTDKYPYAVYEGKIIKANPGNNNKFDVEVDGKMSIHGVSKPLKLKGVLTRKGKTIHIKSSFEIKLTDYNIEVPKFMFLKISEVMKLIVDFNTIQVK